MPHYVVVEGEGDARAVPNLLSRVGHQLGLYAVWKPPLRINVQRPSDAQKVADLTRGRADAQGLLVLRDDEDGCPRDDGPEIASWFQALSLPFPVACVLFYREYETIFLPVIEDLAGRPLTVAGVERRGLNADAAFSGDPESRRDAKGVLTANMPPGRSYKETTDQLAMTQLVDIPRLLASGLPCVETLERALRFLLTPGAGAGRVFPLDR
ncbi:MAG TPA: hypothetical protein VN238_09215 [Solirubrobacteraceae bacterium]|nr:hypothetical protein [Solirubrobacteraceae bacterium]